MNDHGDPKKRRYMVSNHLKNYLGIGCVFALQLAAAAKTNEDLRNFSLPGSVRAERAPASIEGGDEILCRLARIAPAAPVDHVLTRDQKAVALLRVTRAGRVQLNPPGANLNGPIPPLSKMTLTEAEARWASPGFSNKEHKSSCTYKLMLGESPCFLDLEFNESVLQKYRVRCSNIKNIIEEWHST